MPWTVADVESKIGGLSPVQKKRWVEVANSALKACVAKGGTDEACAPKAIRTANAAAKNFTTVAFLEGPLVNIRGMEIFRIGKWNGREFKKEDLERMASNFRELKGQLVPKLKITHRVKQETLAGLASFGDIVNIEARESGGSLRLFADIDFVPKRVAEWIRDKRFAERSIELRFGFKSGDKTFKDVISAVALLGHEIPAVAGMEPIKLSKEDNSLETKEEVGITYSLEDETGDFEFEESSFARGDGRGQGGSRQGDGGVAICVCPECNFEKEHEKGHSMLELSCPKCGAKMIGKDSVNEGGDIMELKEILEKMAKLQSTIDGIVQKQKDAEADFAKEVDAKAKKKIQDELDKYKKDLEGLETLKTDYDKMKTSLEKAEKTNTDLLQKAKEDRVENFLKDLKTSGKLLPAFEVEAKTLLLSLKEEDKLGKFSKTEEGKTTEVELSQFEAFQSLLTKLPKLVGFKETSPAGEGEKENVEGEIKVGDDTFKLDDVELEKEVKKYMKENEGVSYEDAVVAVSARFKKEGKEQGLLDDE